MRDDGKQFFNPGGTLAPDSPSYIKRSADTQLVEALVKGEFVFLLDSRQKGKSSIVARTVGILKSKGIDAVQLDLQRVGANLTPDQWYAGLLAGLGQQLNLTEPLFAYWSAHQAVGPLTRWLGALEHIVVRPAHRPIVIFIDEVDFVRALPFDTDEFFGGIRDCYNRRATDPDFRKVTFCLVGVATPGNLIRNPQITPFNIGTCIELTDFTWEEVSSYAKQIAGPHRNAERLLKRVHYWVGGHPYLTQLICHNIASSPGVHDEAAVDRLVRTKYLSPEARQVEPNLAEVERRLLSPDTGSRSPDEAKNQVLDVVRRLHGRKSLKIDHEDPVIPVLLLSGLVKYDGSLTFRNRLYGCVFTDSWRRANLGDKEVQRQSRAAFRASFRTALIMGAMLAVVGVFAVHSAVMSREAETQRNAAEYEAYVSSMISASQYWEDSNREALANVVAEQSKYGGKGWEWSYWSMVCNDRIIPEPDCTAYDRRWSRDGKHLILRNRERIKWVDPASGALVKSIEAPSPLRSCALELPGGRLLDISWDKHITIYDTTTLLKLWSDEIPELYWRPKAIVDPTGRYLAGKRIGPTWIYDLVERKLGHIEEGYDRGCFSRDGKTLVALHGMTDVAGPQSVAFFDVATKQKKREIPLHEPVSSCLLSPDGQWLVLGFSAGYVRILDAKTSHEVFSCRPSESIVWRMEFSDDGQYLSVGTLGNVVEILRFDKGLVTRLGRVYGALDVAFQPGGDMILASNLASRVMAISEIDSLPVEFDGKGVVQLDKSSAALTLWKAGMVQRFDLSEKVPVVTPVATFKGKLSLQNCPIVLADTEGGTAVYDPQTTKQVDLIPSSYGKVANYLNLPDGRALFITDSYSLWVKLKNGDAQERTDFGRVIAFWPAPDGQHVVFAGLTGELIIWNSVIGTMTRTFAYSPMSLNDVAFSRDMKTFVGAFEDGVLHRVSLSTGKSLVQYKQHSGNARCVRFSPDESRLFSGGGDPGIRIWDASSGQMLSVLKGHLGTVRAIEVVDGGKNLISLDDANTVRVWRTPSSGQNRR